MKKLTEKREAYEKQQKRPKKKQSWICDNLRLRIYNGKEIAENRKGLWSDFVNDCGRYFIIIAFNDRPKKWQMAILKHIAIV